MDIHIHSGEGQINVQHAAGEFSLHRPVLVGLLQCGGEQRGLDHAPAAEESLHGAAAAAGQRFGDKTADADALSPAVHAHKAHGKVPAPGGINGGEELIIAGSVQLLLAVTDVLDGDFGMAEGDLLQKGRHGGGLCAVALHEFETGRGVVEEIAHHDGGALRAAGALHLAGHAALKGEGCAFVRAFFPGEDVHPADGGDGGESLAAKAQCADGGEIGCLAQLAGGMAQKGRGEFCGGDAPSVVRHTDRLHAAAPDLHDHGGGTGINGVFNEFLHHAAGPLHHLAGGDQVGHMGGKLLNEHSRSFDRHVSRDRVIVDHRMLQKAMAFTAAWSRMLPQRVPDRS